MTISRQVIMDLMPLYLAGEASPDSRALVEQFLENAPELRDQVKREGQAIRLDVSNERPEPSADVELRALRRTRGLLAWQRRLFGLGLASTLLPLSSEFWVEAGHFHHRFLLAGNPGLIGGLLSLAFWCWLFYWLVRRQLRTAL